MPRFEIKYTPGTIKNPQHTKITEASFTETNGIHFPDARLTTRMPSLVVNNQDTEVDLLGGCYSIFGFERTGFGYLFGTSSRLCYRKNENLHNVTPIADQKIELLGTNPLGFTSADATMDVTWTAHGLSVGDEVIFSGATDVASVNAATYINISHRVATVTNANVFTVELGTNAGSTTTGGGSSVIAHAYGRTAVLGANPITTLGFSNIFEVAYTAHGLAVGDRVKFAFATAVGGFTASDINRECVVSSIVNANTFRAYPNSGGSTSATSGGGSNVSIFKQISSGNIDQSTASGYGFGSYGSGAYGVSKSSVSGTYEYPRVYSFDNFGTDIVFCPGDFSSGDGQKIYIWDGDTSVAGTVLTNAPTDCNFVMVVNNAVVALCDNRIDISEIGDATVWTQGTGTTAYSKTLERVKRLIGGIRYGEKSALLFSENNVFLLRWVGGTDYWDIVELMDSDGCLGPQASCELNTVIYFRGFRGMYRFAGSYPELLPNPQNGDYITQNLNFTQSYKVFLTPDVKNNQVYMYYPTTGANCDSYVIYNVSGGHWTLGTESRTAAMKKFVGNKLYFANSTSTSSAGTIYSHYLNDTTLPVTWSATTAEAFVGDGDIRFRIDEFMPDSFQSGDISVVYKTREYPQDSNVYTSSTYTISENDTYQTVKAAGRLRSITFSGSNYATLGAWNETIRPLGRR